MSETYDAAATGPDAGHESPGETDSGGYRETEAATEARIADQDQMPAPAESRPATWGDNPDYYDETDLGSEYDGDISAFVAEQDELPPPQESHAATWGDNPDYYDETDLAAEYDGDLSPLTTEEDSHARNADADNRDQDAATTADDEPDQAGTDLATIETGPPPQAQDTAAPSADAHPGQADQAEVPEDDDGNVPSTEADRPNAPESERDADRQKIADLEGELKAVKDQQSILFDRMDQLLSNNDRQPETADPTDHGSEQPGGTRDLDAKSPTIAERKDTDQGTDTKVAEQTRGARWRAVVTGENVGAAGTLVGAADTVAQFAMHATPEGMVGLTAMVLGLASLSLAKYEKHRKETHDRPDQRQAGEGAARSNN